MGDPVGGAGAAEDVGDLKRGAHLGVNRWASRAARRSASGSVRVGMIGNSMWLNGKRAPATVCHERAGAVSVVARAAAVGTLG